MSRNLDENIKDQNVQEAWDTIATALEEIVRDEVPVRCLKKKLKTYMTIEALALRKRKERLWDIYRLTRQLVDKRKFTKVSNELRKKTRKLKHDMEFKIADECKANPKSFWNYVNRRLKVKPAVESLRLADGSLAHSDEDKCKVLSNFFQSVFTRESLGNIPVMEDRVYAKELEKVIISKEEVKCRLEHLKPNKAPGLDGIHPRLLKECASSLCGPLQVLFQKSLESGELPNAWKLAVVKPIFKKGSKHEVGNYIPSI